MNRALRQEVQNSLDSAIASTASSDFDRLRDGLGQEDVIERIHQAMDELEKLRGLQMMPDYDNEWVAPFYTSWYQPRQVCLAYTLIRKIVERQYGRLTHNAAGNLCVVDFGCGALATRFGLTAAVAHAIQDGQNIGRVEVYGTDTSRPLIDMGERLWADWGMAIPDIGALRTAYETVRSVNTTNVVDWVPPETSMADSDVWLVALHTAYRANRVEVRSQLNLMAETLNPRAGFVTSHEANRENVDFISPLDDAEMVEIEWWELEAYCRETIAWRHGLVREYPGLDVRDARYLNGWVNYNLEEPYCLLDVRQE